jgi:mRNA interferase RelE/StbE
LGYRLVYRIDEDVVTVTVIAVGKRDKSAVILIRHAGV